MVRSTKSPYRTPRSELRRVASVWLLFAAFGGCATDDDSASGGTADPFFSPAIEELVIEVDYEVGAAPYTDFIGRPGNPWTLLRVNLEALFEPAPRTIFIPVSLDEMEQLPGLGVSRDFDADRILAIADQYRTVPSTADRPSLYVVFIDGFFADEDGRQPSVLGVTLGFTGVVALFKPVIEGGVTDRFVEQTVLIHELGHALGLVDNGLPPVAAHHDAEHGAHCTNERCVMYWQNEGLADMVEFVRRFVLTESAVVYGPDCLDDARAAADRARP